MHRNLSNPEGGPFVVQLLDYPPLVAMEQQGEDAKLDLDCRDCSDSRGQILDLGVLLLVADKTPKSKI
jgi:hypothetical protein